MTTSSASTRISPIKVALAVIPALLILSICIALYLGAKADQVESEPLKGEVTVSEMADYLNKLNLQIGPRDVTTEDGQRAFRKINAMTMGNLGPENLGYEIFKSQTDSSQGLLWSTIWIEAGDRDSESPVVLAIPLAESGTGVAFGYGLAEYLTSHETKVGVRIVFYPPLASPDLEAWIWERVGAKGESLAGFLKVTGGGPGQEMAQISSEAERLDALRKLIMENKLEEEVIFDDGPSSYLELRLGEQGRVSKTDHARQLIRLMPLAKDLIESFEK